MVVKKVASAALRAKILTIIKAMALAKRSGNVKKEQIEWEKLEKICEKNHMDFEDTLSAGRRHLNETTVNTHGYKY